MKGFNNILLLISKDDEKQLENLIKNANLITHFLKANLSVGLIAAKISSVQNTISKLNRMNRPLGFSLIRSRHGSVKEEVAKLIQEHSINLLLIQYDPQHFDSGNLSHDHILIKQKKELIEFCSIPVLLVPVSLSMQVKPFFSLVVPMSGERKGCESLDIAIQLGNDLDLPVDLVHVSEDKPILEGGDLFDQLSDQISLEYPRLVEEFVAEAIPYCGVHERQCIRNFFHDSGKAIDLINGRMQTGQRSLLLFEWKGFFGVGRARLLKELLTSADYPLLLIKSKNNKHSILKAGRNFRAA